VLFFDSSLFLWVFFFCCLFYLRRFFFSFVLAVLSALSGFAKSRSAGKGGPDRSRFGKSTQPINGHA
jgi:hypothetical protein